MPKIYLSPSTQEYNIFIFGGSEEYYMNLIADAMEPYLMSSGIQFTRNTPDMSVSQIVQQSNAGNYDMHFAIHSNASPEYLAGMLRGSDTYYFPYSTYGYNMANILASNIKAIYPEPQNVHTIPTTSLAEIARTRAPSVLVETAYHDNLEDATWIVENIDLIARTFVLALTEYFDIPFINPQGVRAGVVILAEGSLNLRDRPGAASTVIGLIPTGAQVRIYASYDNWYVVEYNGLLGYAMANYIQII